PIWALTIDRIVQIDVEIQTTLDDFSQEEFNAVERECFDPDSEAMDESEGITAAESFAAAGKAGTDDEFALDDEGDDSDSEDELPLGGFGDSDDEDEEEDFVISKDIEEKVVEMKGWIVKLDSILHLLMGQIRSIADASGESSSYFESLVRTFERTLLPTHKSRFSQFLVFYACSLSPVCTDRFLVLLAQKTFDTSQPNIIRISSSAYLASFVARAKYLEGTSVLQCVRILNGWALRYVDACEAEISTSLITPDGLPSRDTIKRHEVFYAVVQALIYVFCFRWRDIIGAPTGTTTALAQLPPEMAGFQRIMFSKFSPFRICTRSIVNEFARITHKLDILYCYNLIHRSPAAVSSSLAGSSPSGSPQMREDTANPASVGPPAAGDDVNDANETAAGAGYIDDFFPFDPCQLPMASRFLRDVYTEWGEADDADSQASDDSVDGQSESGDARFDGANAFADGSVEDDEDDENDAADLAHLERGVGMRSRGAFALVGEARGRPLHDEDIDYISSSLELMSAS
ncbi:hypothetical protein HK405_007910, partial [Cladochytrium tenue]